jgi:hypothetical protein
MASRPFAHKVSRDYSSLSRSPDSDTKDEPEELIHQRSSSEYESCFAESLRVESDEGPSRGRRRRNQSDSRVPLQGKAKAKKRVSIGRDGSYSLQEEEPLLQQDGSGSVNIPIEQEDSVETKRLSPDRTKRFFGVVLFLVCLTLGLTLIISVHVRTDTAAGEINPAHFNYYKIILIVIFILCLIFKCSIKHWLDVSSISNEDGDTLIPRHLLTGLALFGVCNCALQMVSTLDFLKCSRFVTGLDKSYIATAFFEIVFVFCQIYIFYKLSRRRKQILWFGNLFTMFTLAINLTLWAGYFWAGAIDSPDLKNVTWLRRYYYGHGEDMCDFNNTGEYSRKLHVDILPDMKPYQYTFAMEYALLASALLLHVWLEIATPSAGEFDTTNKKWNVWRFGFIFGLFSLPVLGCTGAYSTTKYNLKNSAILHTIELVVLLLILVGSSWGLWLFGKYYTRRTDTKALKVDIILLCFSSLGYVILDAFTIFASGAEILKTYNADFLLIGFTSFGDLVCLSVLTVFVFVSYFYQMRLCYEGIKAAKKISQIASFCITVNFGFWAIRTYTFRSKDHFDPVGHQYFGKIAWFTITQLSTPMVIFYHFHCAVCLTGIVAKSSVRDWRKHITT